MKDYRPGPLASVQAESGNDTWTLVFARDFRHGATAVWRALTEPEQLDLWAPFTADRNLSSVGPATLTMIDGDTRDQMRVTVTVAQAPHRLEYTWGTDVLFWHLEPTDTGTRLTLRHTVQSEDWLSKVAAGWHICLDVADELLAGRRLGAIRGQEALRYGWDELNDSYASRLGRTTVDGGSVE
jgi:uncharacterized protein YndB with AHSA1/START domain